MPKNPVTKAGGRSTVVTTVSTNRLRLVAVASCAADFVAATARLKPLLPESCDAPRNAWSGEAAAVDQPSTSELPRRVDPSQPWSRIYGSLRVFIGRDGLPRLNITELKSKRKRFVDDVSGIRETLTQLCRVRTVT